MQTRIVIFAKAPVPGQVKTRLIPALGEEGAANLAQRMLTDTYRAASSVLIAETEICATPSPAAPEWKGKLPPQAKRLSEQGDGDLGERLARAAERVVSDDERVVFIGTDCPQLDERRLKQACWELETHDAVIHPTFDGGYALLGLNRFDPSLFSGIGWSGPDVARETIGRVRALGWSLHLGATLRDIDEPEDLAFYEARG
ncbi:MAG TPA: TIGR04282 family arsenosugar biosynthesis glycosyltransferase [Allosphingosinicella sp.]|uniref:TIGR04282 family arsenosugar biosynthesis glycosyltransferase n=1 Tax=Allosphingosinicella sp. TaxID=2823234 RepID=UPI002ED8F942